MKREMLEEMGRRYPEIAPMLDVRLKESGINALRTLLILNQQGLAWFECLPLAMAIAESGRWEGSQNQTMRMRFPLGAIWENEIFLYRVSKDIESIRIASDHPLNVLMTGRKKIQEERATEIIHACYGDLNYKELPELMLQLMGELETVNDLPQIKFTLENVGTYKSIIILDGWSGQIIVNGVPQQKSYSDASEFHKIVLALADEYLDKMTAPV